MNKVYSVACPKCKKETPLAIKNKEKLPEMIIDCDKCSWKGTAEQGIVSEKDFDQWF